MEKGRKMEVWYPRRVRPLQPCEELNFFLRNPVEGSDSFQIFCLTSEVIRGDKKGEKTWAS